MPPYTPVTSKAQSRKLFVLAKQGKISTADAKGKTKAADFKRLPARVGGSGRGAKKTTPRYAPAKGSTAPTPHKGGGGQVGNGIPVAAMNGLREAMGFGKTPNSQFTNFAPFIPSGGR